ncbi:hypothetical protein Hanom_Chr16g01488581 [Helianthus anomalus]
MDPVPVPNRYRIYRTGYLFGTDSVPTFDIFGTGPVPVFCSFLPSNTGTEPVPVPNRVYSVPVPVPTFEDFRYRFFRYRAVGFQVCVWLQISIMVWFESIKDLLEYVAKQRITKAKRRLSEAVFFFLGKGRQCL